MRQIYFLVVLLTSGFVTACLPVGPAIDIKTVGGVNYQVTLWANTQCPQLNETVNVRAEVKNTGTATEVAESNTEPVFDIRITDFPSSADEKILNWNWSDGKALTPELTRIELKPGESQVLEMKIKFSPVGSSYGISAPFRYRSQNPSDSITPQIQLRRSCYDNH